MLKLNQAAFEICEKAIQQKDELRIGHLKVGQTSVLDFGIEYPGSIAAGLKLAQICTSGLASVGFLPQDNRSRFSMVTIETDQPLLACMASQYAGWPVQNGKFFAMGSGPIRALRGKEPLLEKLSISEQASKAVAVLETAKLPTEHVCELMAEESGIPPENLVLACAPTASICGTIQIVARSLETAMHKMFEIGFDLRKVVGGQGSAPLPPVGKNDLEAIGLTNDAILYGGEITLSVDCEDDEELATFGRQIPSSASKDFGRPFSEIFRSYDFDFYKIDPLLFSPAYVTLVNVRTGTCLSFGHKNVQLLRETFVTT